MFKALTFAMLSSMVSASSDTCETIDGDCPDDCSLAGFKGTHNFNALLWISPFNLKVENMARKAEIYIRS